MATGTPKKLHKSNSVISLSYSGKKKSDELMLGVSADLIPLKLNHSSKSRLIFGENSLVLRSLLKDPDLSGKVKLIYIDPPYATETTFHSRSLTHAYDDILSGADYLEFLRERLILLHELLAQDGSIYLHLDEKMVFHAKVLLDEIFGADKYRNCIVRKKCNPKNFTKKTFGNMVDFILFYTKSNKYVWNKQYEPWGDNQATEYRYVEPETGRNFMKVPVHAPGIRRGATGKQWRGKLPPKGKHWQYTPDKLDEMDARGEIFWSTNGNPRRKVYLDESKGIGVQDLWLDYKDAHNQNIKITGYPTEKNPDLLKRIISASSSVGDIVLDCFSGSGTTAHVASELNRHWIGVDNSPEAIKTTLTRFSKPMERMGDFVQKETLQETLFNSEYLYKTEERSFKFSIYVERSNLASAEQFVFGCASKYSSEIIKVAQNELATRDQIIGCLISRYGNCGLAKHNQPFELLLKFIIGQQLSKKAAETIWFRVLKTLSGTDRVSPQLVIACDQSVLRSCGVSKKKLDCIIELSNSIVSGDVDIDALQYMADQEIVDKLMDIKGIGVWTTNMFLIFGLARMNIFPKNDVAIRNAIQALYGKDVEEPTTIASFENKWTPFSSIACWYLYMFVNYRSLDLI